MPTSKRGTSFRLSDEAHSILSRLTAEQNATQVQIVETALKTYARAWDAVNRCIEDDVRGRPRGKKQDAQEEGGE